MEVCRKVICRNEKGKPYPSKSLEQMHQREFWESEKFTKESYKVTENIKVL